MVGDWTLSLFAALLCLGSGLLAALAASEFSNFTERTLKTLASLGFVCLALGGLAAISNLGRPSMILGVFANPASRLFWEMIGVAGALLTSAAYLAALFREADQTITRVIILLSALFAFVATAALGANMVMSWRPVLSSYTLMIPFIGLYWTAASLSFLLACELEDADGAKARASSFAASAVSVIGFSAYIAGLLANPDTSEAGQQLVTGVLSLQFWIGCVFCGILLPLAAALLRKARKLSASVGLIGVFIASFLWQSIIFDIGRAAWHFFNP
ncbi:hypothetical protein [uncultured Parasutterella sp.]|uniref:hypothetical protein n=1 Tax=uncultured Parasutterella sp. TaxID=1263098 RepID=UPI0025996C8F|nr:hypothetical protein [uncultured Parasutterella sp.]